MGIRIDLLAIYIHTSQCPLFVHVCTLSYGPCRKRGSFIEHVLMQYAPKQLPTSTSRRCVFTYYSLPLVVCTGTCRLVVPGIAVDTKVTTSTTKCWGGTSRLAAWEVERAPVTWSRASTFDCRREIQLTRFCLEGASCRVLITAVDAARRSLSSYLNPPRDRLRKYLAIAQSAPHDCFPSSDRIRSQASWRRSKRHWGMSSRHRAR